MAMRDERLSVCASPRHDIFAAIRCHFTLRHGHYADAAFFTRRYLMPSRFSPFSRRCRRLPISR